MHSSNGLQAWFSLYPLSSLISLCALLNPKRAAAGDTGTLRLKVVRCQNSQSISGAQVAVSVTRSGVGVVDSASDSSNSEGFVRFTFTNLENNDEAHVTVTPIGENHDDGHVYHWVSGGGRTVGYWELGEADDTCADSWYDQTNNIIQCLYK